jgi:hypothetical protein
MINTVELIFESESGGKNAQHTFNQIYKIVENGYKCKLICSWPLHECKLGAYNVTTSGGQLFQENND